MDGICDDGGYGAETDTCELGTDCTDCDERIDGDGDGYFGLTDCDDTDATVYPTEEVCDGLDNDCDGAIDEDTDVEHELGFVDGTWMTAVSIHPGAVGLTVDVGTVSGMSYITWDGDVDLYSFYFDDPGDTELPDDDQFSCTVTPPPGIDVSIILVRLVPYGFIYYAYADEAGIGGAETVVYDESWEDPMELDDDSATYGVFTSSEEGSSCTEPVTIVCTRIPL